ncbi:sensor histidine kinase [Streptomyces sp. NPDC048172]|uniref:sensor histidine kinase n=1 Tax=Streptomyces sp. NPDC048172 TaxID=3365505 RepID=UPI003715A450
MERTDDRFLPVLLLAAQALVWPGAALLRGATPSAAELLAAVLVYGLVTVALAVRRARPVPVLVLVAAACALGAAPLPTGALAVLGTAGVALALLTVALERDTATTLLCVGTLALWQLLHELSLHGLGLGSGDGEGLALVLTALLYAAATGGGLWLRRRREARRTAERRLHRAEAERHRLPAAERRRMERELHDVSAHHLTAVVVTVEAAVGLRERRPEMAGEALEFAASAGREVTRALSAVKAPAPSAEDLPAPEERLRELVAGFRALGQPVTCEIDALPDGAVADAAYGIVREALTNVVRHASGAATTVRCAYGDAHTEVVVRNEPAAGAEPSGLGGGRGQNLLRGRAREAGGTLATGPTADGGWEVRALLPGRTAAAPSASVPRSYRLAQALTAAGLCFQPLLPVLVLRDDAVSSGSGVPAGVLFTLLATAQALALLRLRRAPRATLGVELALAALWPAAVAASGYAGPAVLPPVLSALATCLALAGCAARAAEEGDARSGLAVPGAAALVHAAAATASVALVDDGPGPLWAVAAGAAAASAGAAGAAWWAGARYGVRRRGAREAHEGRLAAWTEEAVRDAWAERRRITAGLETTVLARTAEVVEAAEGGELSRTAERAREALAAMRALLDTVRDGEDRAELRPQPTLQALDLLVHQWRATGREVEVRVTERVPERLSAEVDLAAYRAAELVLEAGNDEPATLVLDADGGELTLTATGVPGAAHRAARERLAARAAALGGTLTADRPDAVLLRLPLTTPANPATPALPQEENR